MRAHEEGAQRIAEFLEGHPAVGRVNYPGLASHPQHELARRQMAKLLGGRYPSRCGATGAPLRDAMAKDLEVVHYAVSLGHHRSLIYWIDTDALMESSFRLEGAQLANYREYAGDGVFRLSVGLEDAQDLCADLESGAVLTPPDPS